jgi:hypothetical protein
MIPEDFFEGKDPDDETFEPTGNAGIAAERQYRDEDAIVVWPRSSTWIVVTGNRLEKMISYLMLACSTGSESMAECKAKLAIVCNRLAHDKSPRGHERDDVFPIHPMSHIDWRQSLG